MLSTTHTFPLYRYVALPFTLRCVCRHSARRRALVTAAVGLPAPAHLNTTALPHRTPRLPRATAPRCTHAGVACTAFTTAFTPGGLLHTGSQVHHYRFYRFILPAFYPAASTPTRFCRTYRFWVGFPCLLPRGFSAHLVSTPRTPLTFLPPDTTSLLPPCPHCTPSPFPPYRASSRSLHTCLHILCILTLVRLDCCCWYCLYVTHSTRCCLFYDLRVRYLTTDSPWNFTTLFVDRYILPHVTPHVVVTTDGYCHGPLRSPPTTVYYVYRVVVVPVVCYTSLLPVVVPT